MSNIEQVAPLPAPIPEKIARPGRDLVIDLIIVVILFLGISIIVPAAFIIMRIFQQGLTLAALQGMQQTALLKLIGVDGIVTLLFVQNALFVGLPVARVIWLQRRPASAIGLQFERPLRLIAIGIGLGVLVLISNIAFSSLFAFFDIRQNQAAQYPLYKGDYIGQAFFLIGAAILAPVGEEMLFRGYIFNALRRIWGEKRWGMIGAYGLSAFLFLLAHSGAASEGLIALLLPAFLMGLLLAWGMQRTGSILPCIIAHGMNNGLALLALLACVNGVVPCPGT
jgi:membrane protease YdiL (CAAX protease family)